MNPSDIKKMIKGALGSVRLGLRGKIQRAAGNKRVVLVQADGLATETFNDTEVFQQPGFRSIPLAGMQPIILPLNGTSANGVIVAISNGALFIADLQPGEVAVFNETDGVANSVVLRNGKIIDVTCDVLNIKATTKVTVTTAQADISVSGDITSSAATWSHTGRVRINGNLDVSERTTTGSINVG